MSIWKSTLVTGCALGTLIAVGVVNTATGGHMYHGKSMTGYHQQSPYEVEAKTRHFEHPVYGPMFKHPVYGYKFKHPVLGYMFKHPAHGYTFKHPVHGYTFKHPVHGYKFKHPVYGYIKTSMVGQSIDDRSPSALESEAESVSTQ